MNSFVLLSKKQIVLCLKTFAKVALFYDFGNT